MKSKKLNALILAAVACSGLALITSCNNSHGNSVESSSVSSEGVSATSISFSKTSVTDIAIGDTIDLDKYVTIAPATATYTVTTSSDAVTIKDHIVTGVKAGTFRLSIQAGSNGIKKNYPSSGNGYVQSAERTALMSYVKDLANNYTAAMTSGGESVSTTLHNENYYLRPEFDSTGKFKDFGGLIKAGDSKSYAFSYLYDANYTGLGGTLTVKPGQQVDISKTYMGQVCPITTSDFTDAFDTDGNATAVTLSADTIANLTKAAFVFDVDAINSAIKITKPTYTAQMISDTASKVSMLEIDAFSSGSSTAGWTILIGDKNDSSLKDFDNYIAAKTVPTPLANTAFNTAVTDIVTNKKAYKQESKTLVGYYDNSDKWVEGDSTAISNASSDWSFSENNYTAYVNGTDYYSADKDGNVQAAVIHNSKLYSISGTASKATDGTTSVAYTAEAFTSLTDIWTANIASSFTDKTGAVVAKGRSPFTLIDLSATALSAINYTDVSTDTLTYDLNGYGDAGFIYEEIVALTPFQGAYYDAIMTTLYSSNDATLKWYDFFDSASITVALDNAKAVTGFTFELYLGSAVEQADESLAGLRWTTTISAIGTDNVPTDYLSKVDFGDKTTSSSSASL